MKGKKITSVSPWKGISNFLGSYSAMAFADGKEVIRSEIGDIIVDTCVPVDTDIWETGILRKSKENEWIIVSQYRTAKEAQKGHKGWVTLVTNDPACELKDIDMWNLGELE